ncbi:MAG: dUTP diphosphatase [Deltaproteobacteria bacterium]|nr:dUTP diphosphatase [Deltaproteobacteria bacterium]NIS76565.1 dUTP diphosphatase [Deltaproteobacteria bacterium]
MEFVVKVKLTGTDDPLFAPSRQTPGSAGCDLRACIDHDLVIKPYGRALVSTGISVAIPSGYEAQVRPRSGIAYRHGVTLLNTPGTIDSDYRGEIKVILINLGDTDFVVKRGDRIAQMIFSRYDQLPLKIVNELDETGRGEGGFGSTERA